jgi:uncharacterized protein
MPQDKPAKPLPRMVASEAPFWEGCAAGELRLQKCTECGHWRFPPSSVCPACLSEVYTWEATSGRGRVWSWIVMHQKYFAAFEDDLPYNVALVELDEGPRLMSTVVPYDPSAMSCDAAVEVRFEPRENGVSVPRFTLVGTGGDQA